MDMIVLLALVVAMVAWLTAAGTAARNVSPLWLRHWSERRASGGIGAMAFRPERMEMIASSGAAMLVALCGVLLSVASARRGWSLPISASAMLLALLVVGLMLPKVIAHRWATRLAPVLLPTLRWPGVVVSVLGRVWRRAWGGRRLPESGRSAEATASDIDALLREGARAGLGQRDALRLISGVARFGGKVVSDVMTPREAVVAIDAAVNPRLAARALVQSGYSRVPVYRGSRTAVIGMVHAMDVFRTGAASIPAVRPVSHVEARTPCSDALMMMLRDRCHLAVVRDDGGSMSGIITLEDVLRALMGEVPARHRLLPAVRHAEAARTRGTRIPGRAVAADRPR
ncbi:MAG TPA: CBS domain-containing protein [Gemmatimonadaceae bacterium]|nr:CBS domain-containing protein [Gemmatimonadaceae bacterium]